MSYPTLPQNRLVVNGVDLTTQYGLIMSDDYILEPPSPKTHTVSIPCGNGKIDLTETLTGDTAYDNRKQEFPFFVLDPNTFESVKRQVCSFLHGQEYDYTLTMDPGYTYHGRFSVSSYNHAAYSNHKVGYITIVIDAEPYKRSTDRVYTVGAVGGTEATFESGRMRVRPIIETSRALKIIFNKKETELPSGTWQLNDIMFSKGNNEVYFNSYPVKNLTWGDMSDNSITWGTFKTKKLYKWYKSNGDGTQALNAWSALASQTWSSLSSRTWSDISFTTTSTPQVPNIYIQYEVGEL